MIIWIRKYIYMDIVYYPVTSNHACGHIEGSAPFRCEYSASDCENKCTSFDWCVAYSTDGDLLCTLISSSGLCPGGGSSLNGPIATSSNDLASHNVFGYGCQAKVIGRSSNFRVDDFLFIITSLGWVSFLISAQLNRLLK